LADIAYKQGLILYPRRPVNGLQGDHLLIAPPLIITPEQVSELLQRLEKALTCLMEEIKDGGQSG